jgi:preprotein translocase subunit SecF
MTTFLSGLMLGIIIGMIAGIMIGFKLAVWYANERVMELRRKYPERPL